MPTSGPLAIVGCGLIGGSLLKALHPQGADLICVDSDEATRQAIQAELQVDASPELTGIAEAKLVVLALPVEVLLTQLPAIGQVLRDSSDVVVTDVAGIKVPVLEAMRAHLPANVAFVGGHPMAGKERGGFQVAEAELFVGRPVAICPAEGQPDRARELVERLWRAVGARTLQCEAAEHDAAVARVSHLPHLVAAALSTVAGEGTPLSDRLAAGGLRDTTRVAEDPTIRQALVRNPAVAKLAREVAQELLAYADALDAGRSIDAALDAAAAARRRIFKG